MMQLLSTPLALRLAWCLVHFLWQGALLGLLAWITLALLRGRPPRLRYGAACAFLVLCALAPILTFFYLGPVRAGALAPATTLALGFDPGPMQALPRSSSVETLAWRARLSPWLPGLLLAWMTGCSFLGLRAMGGWLWLQQLRRSATPSPESGWAERVRDLAARTGIARSVRLLQSARIDTPMALGLLRPVILVPLGFFAQVDAAGAEAVLAHELAHLRRLDPLVNGFQCLLETLLFFHPAVHFISRRVRTERECCCDEDAVMACGDAVLYVETLCRLDALRDRHLSLALSARGGNLMERIQRLLAPASAPRVALLIATLAMISLGASVLLAQTPKKHLPAAPSAESAPVAQPAPAVPGATPRPLALPPAAADPWGDKGERTPFPLQAESLHEAILKFAEARNLDAVIGSGVPDRKGAYLFRHAPWREALESLLKAHGLACVIQGRVLRVDHRGNLQGEAEWRLPIPKMEPTLPVAPVVEVKTPPAAQATLYSPPRRILFTLRQGKDGAPKLRLDARRATREELLEALRKIEHLAKAGLDGERPLQGEWSLPFMKEDSAADLLTFELDGVTTQSVRELYR